MATIFMPIAQLHALGVTVDPRQVVNQGPGGPGAWVDELSLSRAVLEQQTLTKQYMTKPAAPGSGAAPPPAAPPQPEAKYEGRRCSLCDRLKPSYLHREDPTCRQPGSAECRTYAEERERRIVKSAGRLRYGNFW